MVFDTNYADPIGFISTNDANIRASESAMAPRSTRDAVQVYLAVGYVIVGGGRKTVHIDTVGTDRVLDKLE